MSCQCKSGFFLTFTHKNVCKVEGCNKPHHANGFCNTHYYADRRKKGIVNTRTCSVMGCDKPHHAKGFCNYHYQVSRQKKSS